MPPDPLPRTAESLRAPDLKGPRQNNSSATIFASMNWLDRKSPTIICALNALLIPCIGILSYATGPQLSCSLFYLIPILLVTRVAGFLPGTVAAILAATSWLTADLAAGFAYDYPITPYWNGIMRLGTFLVAVSLVSAMRSLNSHLEERVTERTIALENQIADNYELEKQVLEISDREQVRIGQDLHDGLSQHLVSAAFSANMLHEELARTAAHGTPIAARISNMIDEAITQARNLTRGLYPVRLETEGLELALQELASTSSQRFNIPCNVECPDSLTPFSANTGIHLYRIAQEAVTNAAKHAFPRKILIHLSADSSHFLLKIQDDGVGIDRDGINPQGMGLSIMEYRARMIGAEFQVNRLSTGGTEVVCALGS